MLTIMKKMCGKSIESLYIKWSFMYWCSAVLIYTFYFDSKSNADHALIHEHDLFVSLFHSVDCCIYSSFLFHFIAFSLFPCHFPIHINIVWVCIGSEKYIYKMRVQNVWIHIQNSLDQPIDILHIRITINILAWRNFLRSLCSR